MQQINLYQDEFKKPYDPFTPEIILKSIVAATGVLFVVALGFEAVNYSAAQRVKRADNELIQHAQKSSELANELSVRNRQASLSSTVALAEAKLASSQVIREFLSNLQTDNLLGYSFQLKDLARAAEEGLRLTSFEIFNGGSAVILRGESITSDAVPRFVQSLEGSESGLRNERFSSRIERRDVSLYTFELTSLDAQRDEEL